MRRKISITLPEGIIDAVKQVYPNSPLSTGITLILERGLQSDSPQEFRPTDPQVKETPDPADLIETIRELIREEMSRTMINPPPPPVPDPAPTLPAISPQTPFNEMMINPEQWYSNGELAALLPESIPLRTRIAKISKAVSLNQLTTNGGRHRDLRIHGASAIEWIKSTF